MNQKLMKAPKNGKKSKMVTYGPMLSGLLLIVAAYCLANEAPIWVTGLVLVAAGMVTSNTARKRKAEQEQKK